MIIIHSSFRITIIFSKCDDIYIYINITFFQPDLHVCFLRESGSKDDECWDQAIWMLELIWTTFSLNLPVKSRKERARFDWEQKVINWAWLMNAMNMSTSPWILATSHTYIHVINCSHQQWSPLRWDATKLLHNIQQFHNSIDDWNVRRRTFFVNGIFVHCKCGDSLFLRSDPTCGWGR